MVGVVVWLRPDGVVHVTVSGAGWAVFQPGACLVRWCRRHFGFRLHWSVGPSGYGTVWSRSLNTAWALHAGAVQVWLRAWSRCLSLRPGT